MQIVELNSLFRMIAVDRPGYGMSGFGDPEPSIKRQAGMLSPILTHLEEAKRPVLICAASYGVSIACRLIMDHPGIADGLVMDAPSLAPGQEKIFWITSTVQHSFIKWLIPPHHRVANAEKYYHTQELRKMLPYWNRIRIPVIYIQGEKDGMVYKTNADFAKKHLVNCPFLQTNFIPGKEHFITIKEMPFIKGKIFEMYRLIRSGRLVENVS